MLTRNDVKKRLLVNLQDYPEVALRYQNGDPTISAMLQAHANFIADQSSDIDIALIEPFIKSRDDTILADATNKAILPIATPCQHHLTMSYSGNNNFSISAGRLIEDIQGRIWRLLQTAVFSPKSMAQVLAEQSQVRTVDYRANFTETFHQVTLDIQEDLNLCSLRIYDDEGNHYVYRPRWMNSPAGEYAYTLKTNTMRQMVVEFGDSQRCGTTLQANTTLHFELIESDGYIEASALKEASLMETVNNDETKVNVLFTEGGLVQSGADPLSIEQVRLLSSYPTHDDNAVFLSDFDYAVRKKFMGRCHYLTVWNEALQERYYGATLDDINHLNVSFAARNEAERLQLATEMKNHIARLDTLYTNRVNIRPVAERPFHLTVKAKLAPVHNVDSVREEIRTLLLSRYGQETIAASYFVADGFNSQEMSELLRKNISAFQDRISDFRIEIEEMSENPIKPHEWVFMTVDSIALDIQRTATTGASLWTI